MFCRLCSDRRLALNVDLMRFLLHSVYFHLLISVSLSVWHPHSVSPSRQFLLPPSSSLTDSLCFFLPPIPAHLLRLPQKNEGDLFHRLWHVMNEILDLRRQVLVGHLTHDRMRDVKQHITARLDWGNE